MRTRDIKAEEVYATCDGYPVKAVTGLDEEVHSKWQQNSDGTFSDMRVAHDDTPPEDAWQKCLKKDSAGRKIKAVPQGTYKVAGPGLRVVMWEYHGPKGELTGEVREQIVDPRDIAGTWKDFLLLHPDVALERYRRNLADWLDAEAKHHVRVEQSVYNITEDSKSVGGSLGDRDMGFRYDSTYHSGFGKPNPEAADGLPWPAGTRQPHGIVLSLFIPFDVDGGWRERLEELAADHAAALAGE